MKMAERVQRYSRYSGLRSFLLLGFRIQTPARNRKVAQGLAFICHPALVHDSAQRYSPRENGLLAVGGIVAGDPIGTREDDLGLAIERERQRRGEGEELP